MGLIFPNIRRRARQFEYKPRHFDIEKDAREERRKELCGDDTDKVADAAYVPGQYIRRDMLARRGYGKKKQKDNSGRRRVLIGVCVGLIVVLIIRYLM